MRHRWTEADLAKRKGAVKALALPRTAGRLKERRMNKLEATYAHILEFRRLAGEIRWWAFEGIKLRLADNTFYTPDFAVEGIGGEIEIHETKGFWRDDARVKLKVAAEMFPFRFLVITRTRARDGRGWKVEEI